MKVYYPPVGIAHITNDLSDLLQDRLADASNIRVACISQPKSAPHFGTMIVIFCAFSLAKKLKKDFNLDSTVLVDFLENAPAREFKVNGHVFSTCLSHHFINDKSIAEINTALLTEVVEWVSKISGINYTMRSYREIQSQKIFRVGLQDILKKTSEFIPIMSPSEHHLRIRPICPECGSVDKEAKTVKYDNVTPTSSISFLCPNHGKIEAFFANENDLIDCNAPIRTVLRSLSFAHDRKIQGKETIIVNGADWAGAWMQRVYFDGLANLNCVGRSIPFNLFTPEITDWSGAKLSKTIYLEQGAYKDLDEVWLSAPIFMEKMGEAGLLKLWSEIESWIDSPRRFFRNYSIEYIKSIFS